MTFDHNRPVPPEWQADLESVIPRTQDLPWLKLVWQPGLSPRDAGSDEQVVQRWEVYECFHPRFIPSDIMAELKGPDPRSLGQFVTDLERNEDGVKTWQSWCNISRVQWDIYQETGFGSQRFWIIQGSHGGHVWTLSRTEKSFLKAMGLAYDTPMPGALPYAEYTHAVALKMAEVDRLRKWRNHMDWNERTVNQTQAGIWLAHDRDAEEKEWSERMLLHLTNEIEEVVSDMPRTIVNELMMGNDKAPRGLYDEGFDHDLLDSQLTGGYDREIARQMK